MRRHFVIAAPVPDALAGAASPVETLSSPPVADLDAPVCTTVPAGAPTATGSCDPDTLVPLLVCLSSHAPCFLTGTIKQDKNHFILCDTTKLAGAGSLGGVDGPGGPGGRCPYKIEYAKSNRSICQYSNQPIPHRAIRLSPPMQQTGFDENHRIEGYFYGLEALFKMFRDHPKAFWISSPEQIAGFGRLKKECQEIVKQHIKALVDERAAAGVAPVHSVYTKPCWERRALLALKMNDKAALKAALEEEGADVTTKVGDPRIGYFHRGEDRFRETDVKIFQGRFCSYRKCVVDRSNEGGFGLFYTADMEMVWGSNLVKH